MFGTESGLCINHLFFYLVVLLLFWLLKSFSHELTLSLSDNKFPQISRTLLSILSDLNNVIVWMVFTRPLISKSSSLFNNPLVIVRRAPITISINVTFFSHNLLGFFFSFLARSRYLSLFSFSFNFTQHSPQFSKYAFFSFSFLFFFFFFLLIIKKVFKSGRDFFYLYVSQNPKGVCASHSLGHILDCSYTIYSYGQNWNFLNSSQWITLTTKSFLVLYSFCANLLHSIIIFSVLE